MADLYYKAERLEIFGDQIRYAPDESGRVGMFIHNFGLKPECNYFEVLIEDIGTTGGIAIGLVSSKHPLDQYPGYVPDSIGYISEGRLYKDTPKVIGIGPKFYCQDRLGCGLKFKSSPEDTQENEAAVFFTKNGKEIGQTVCTMPAGGLYPAVGLNAFGAQLFYIGRSKWTPEEDMSMCIDSNEEEWSRLHDIKLNGSILEYAGRGKSIIDVGLAQAKYPLDTTHHYFEIEILDPGENCYIAIGLARKDYPKYRHPGWNKGSIAYHADDGKIFVGSGVGDPFGPRCYKGDIMGCGIMFPRDFVCYFDCDESSENGPSSLNADFDDELSGSLSESEDEEWWKAKENIEFGVNIQVFFTRNGKTIGQKDVCIPKGGFYPTIGMLSSDEKVKVDLHPLTG
ncbi:SPRY domain-containing protein 3 [Parasteatoda tepidariorum]|uniref:SPRY domain-containing protein 3 n=1 Tax=Parasteatoda tepidariorum TaxID=114398 RepID=UPI001C71C9F7|nr:SPRY domain-containing protein 3 [Parasteatoda tepidariorum]XP_042898989.1 SPRY domain-containing protein 3 [Parasteatoda tepidariorum]